MAPHFKYDIVTLIKLVESKPCIWDKKNKYNKNKLLRERSWQEIFQHLEDGYDQLSQAEKQKIGKIVMAKWTNIKDSFLRSLRTKNDQGAKKSYIYSEHLQFLMKLAQKDETVSNFSQAETEDHKTEVEEFTESQLPTKSSRTPSSLQPQPVPSTSRSTSSEHRSKSKRQLDEIDREILSELKKGKQSVEPVLEHASQSQHFRSDHELLLLSFIPYIRDMNETELMDFQMQVLTTIKEIKQQRVLYQQQLSPAISYSDSYQS